jgi:hypothetical protein
MFSRFLSVAVVVCAVLGLTFAGLNTANATVNFCINPGFEIGGYADGAGCPNYTDASQPPEDHNAMPWSIWGSWSPPNAYPQAAIPNPFIDANNPSARVWANFNNPYYVNVASQNNGNLRPKTGFWLVPGASYHFTAQVYVPSSEIVLGTTTARLGLTLSMSASNPAGQSTSLRPLDARFYEVPTVEPPTGPITPVISPVITPDQWNTFDLDYVFPGPLVQHCNYPAARLYGGDGRYLGQSAGTPPAKPAVACPNPGGYFDNVQISSTVYRDDLQGFVKDGLGNPISGATVTLTSPFTTAVDVVTTLANGSYTLPTWAPFGYTFSVDATYPGYTSTGPQTLNVSGTAGLFPQITMVPEPATLALMGLGGIAMLIRRKKR